MNTRVISSDSIDELAKLILDADFKNAVEVPTRLSAVTTYDQRLAENYRPQDVALIKQVLVKSNLTSEEMSTMDALLRWNFRNNGTLVRSVYGLIATALAPLIQGSSSRDMTIAASGLDIDFPVAFSKENMWAIRRMIRMTVATGAHECKIPRNAMWSEYDELIKMSDMFGTDVYDVEVDMIKNQLLSLSSTDPIDKTRPKMEVARKLCLQMVMAISEYRQDDTFGRLRGFLNNVCHFASIVRIESSAQGSGLNRLCMDVLDQVHSTDRLLNSNCIAAQGLLDRMKKGEVVYGSILELGKHQHRVMAIEVASCIGMFSYLIKQCGELIDKNDVVYKTMSRLLKFSGISARYTSEITNKMA